MCGCGEWTGARFVNGHNGKLMRRLYQAELRGMMPIINGRAYRPSFYAAMVSPVFAGYFHELLAENNERTK